MSALVEEGKPAEDLGAILARVQDDLQLLRSTVARAGAGAVDQAALDSVLSRTERGVQAASEWVLSSELGQVTILPPVHEAGGKRDTASSRKRSRGGPRSEGRTPGLREMADISSSLSPIHQARFSSLTPGEQCQTIHRARLVMQPSLPATRKLLSQQYSLPSTADSRMPRGSKVAAGKLYSGGTIPPLTILPHSHRKNVMLTPPPITEGDAQRGLLSLLERQLIPPAAEIVLDPPPVKSRTVQLLSASQQFVKPKFAMEQDVCGGMVGVKLATDHISVPPLDHRGPYSPALPSPSPAHIDVHIIQPRLMTPCSTKQVHLASPVVLPAPPSTADLNITVQNGHTVTESQDFQMFQKFQSQKWSDVCAVLGQLETMCRNYAIPRAVVNCSRLVELACEHELGLKIRRQELLSCLLNGRDVVKLLRQAGQRYRGENGRNAAASKIQATYRMFSQRSRYLRHRRQCWAVGVISTAWTMFARRYRVRVQLAERRSRELAAHRERAGRLRERWSSIQQGKRVLIHLPSLGHPLSMRRTETQLSMEQSLQLARITDVQDPNVEVVYVSAVEVGSEVREYYSRLLAMGPTGSDTAMDRVHLLTPEHLHTFSSHFLPLSSLLALSPRTVQRIKRLTTGREAYIVPGVVSRDDMTVADMLGVPLLGPDSEASQLYSTRAGARKIFTEAKIPTPPFVSDVVSEAQLVEELARLVAGNPSIQRWLLKLPHHTRGRGFAYCDVVDHLQCYQWLVRESERYGDKWKHKWPQEQALRQISKELPSILASHATPVDSDLYPTWGSFLADFLVSGGLIEGHPPSTSVTAVTVDLLIEPTGDIQVLSMQDQICAQPYQVWGVSVPQCSVPPGTLLSSAQEVGVACRGRGIVGHLSVDFITFIHPTTLSQELWAVDLDLGYSNHLALQRLLGYVTGATVEPDSGQLVVGSSPRFAVLSPRLYHTNLSVVHYSVFFQMCKAHHIGYNAKESVGTLFSLVDREHKDHLGIICLQPSLDGVLSCCSKTLSTIHQEISTPLMQGHSNFQAVCEELDCIAALVRENGDQGDQEEQR